ncbi:hypothetical protein T05_3366 [Trichinella murrelli]|uniref:Uncharacterized protein n=1 Tax=Trichinella murrelli TaxID=144512 RepID=A0A0V0TE31_9BILA|nr:hypothetical protein T05_3366 [Trichinella murrelli]
MDFQMPLLPTVENTQPKGQKLANELENELDVRKFKKHKHLGSQNIRFLKYHLTLIQTAVYIKGNLILKKMEGLFATSPSLAFSHHGNIVDLLALFSPCSDQFRSRLCAIPG